MSDRLDDTRQQQVLDNSPYAEGWARYAEALSEELGLLESTPSRVLRRDWPARGMVAIGRLHALDWRPEQAVDFMAESGDLSEEAALDLLDRVAAIPAWLTSCDTGATSRP